ncbi:hypothetical protein LWI29_036833 [Acer saccharum]|uniref:PPM-type phosphatase domain-containing protein n=1 Tax=Acer saccharum TaxID=4024 RepID=A0AA39SYD9_ACESA|nr:hypothetical protein LWI29_036833 [Acer saccharum]
MDTCHPFGRGNAYPVSKNGLVLNATSLCWLLDPKLFFNTSTVPINIGNPCLVPEKMKRGSKGISESSLQSLLQNTQKPERFFQASSHCANELHIKLAEEWGKEVGIDDWRRRWEVALCRAFERVDDGLIDRTLASVGSTASVVILSACQIIAANCGDSRVVLCRGKQAIPLTVDHKLNRQDEVARITDGGGIIVEWGYCLRVEGVLSMTRAIGDHSLKPYIIPVPEITFTTRTAEDEFLVLASDGLWDVLSNDDVITLAHKELREHRRRPKSDDNSSCPASFVAEGLVKYALDAYSQDNISVIVVDLKLPRIRVQQKQ